MHTRVCVFYNVSTEERLEIKHTAHLGCFSQQCEQFYSKKNKKKNQMDIIRL